MAEVVTQGHVSEGRSPEFQDQRGLYLSLGPWSAKKSMRCRHCCATVLRLQPRQIIHTPPRPWLKCRR